MPAVPDSDLDAIAARLGLDAALAIDRKAFAAALEAAAGLQARTRKAASIAEEPAHVFRPSGRPGETDVG